VNTAERTHSPDEHPFSPLSSLPQPIITPQTYPTILHAAAASHPSVNVNHRILEFYVGKIVPRITADSSGNDMGDKAGKAGLEDDGNYGSAATRDVEVLQALSRRIHFGQSCLHSLFFSLWDSWSSEES